MLEELIPIIAIICIFGLPIGGWIAIRMMQHQERIEMIKRGMMPPPAGADKWAAASGAWSRTGPSSVPAGPNYGAQAMLRKGIMTTFIGFALLIGLSFIGFHDGGAWVPGPWLLGGLIPMFVGIAQVIGALMSGADFPSVRPTIIPGPRFEAPPQPPPPPPSGPYTYRPSGDQDELPHTKPPQQI